MCPFTASMIHNFFDVTVCLVTHQKMELSLFEATTGLGDKSGRCGYELGDHEPRNMHIIGVEETAKPGIVLM